MNTSEVFINRILISMSSHIDVNSLSILKEVMLKTLQSYKIEYMETLPVAYDNSNEYIVQLFVATKGSKLSPKTVSYYLDTIKRLLTFAHNKSLTAITSIDINCFLNSLKRDNTEVSLNNHRRNISAFFTWMRKSHLVIENPCEAIEPYKQIEKPIDHLEATEYDQLKSGCKTKRDRAIIEFLRSTAMRVGEISSVKISDINWSTGLISIYGEKTCTYRPVCLDSIAIKYLSEYITERKLSLSSDAPVFTQMRSYKSLGDNGIRDTIHNIKARSGLARRVYPHLFRKTTATNIVLRGGSIHDAGEYLGHKDSSTAGKHYSYISNEHTINIFKKYVATI